MNVNKEKLRKLVREMQSPMSLSGFRQAAQEREDMPTSLASPLAAGRPVGERIAGMPMSLRAPAEELILSILDLLESTVEEKGIAGAEAVARGVTSGLKSRGMQLGMTEGRSGSEVQKILSTATKEELEAAREKYGTKDKPGSDNDEARANAVELVRLNKKFKSEGRMSETAIRSEIRRVLLEQDPLAKDEKKEEKGAEQTQLTPKAMGFVKQLAREMGIEGSLSPEKVAPIDDDLKVLIAAAAKGASAAKRVDAAMDKSSQLQSVEKQLKLQ